MNITWDAQGYTDSFSFVHRFGEDVLSLLDAPEEFIAEMNALDVPGVQVRMEPSVKCGVMGTHVSVTVNGEDEEFKAGGGIIEKQISVAKATDNYGGVAFFSYSSLVDPDCKREFENIKSSVFTELAVEEEGQQSSGNTE